MRQLPQNNEQILNNPTIFIYFDDLQLSLYINNRIVCLQPIEPYSYPFHCVRVDNH